jgi:ribosomal protein S18 acetylase RimI-like enzyme
MEIKRAIEFGDDIRERLGEVYVDAFYDDVLKYFSKDKAGLIKAFARGFLLEYFYVAIIGNEIVGMVACMGKGKICFNFDLKTFIKYLGLFRGLFTSFGISQFIKGFPKLDEKTALIEYLAVDTKHLRMGVASTLVKSLFTLTEYKNYLLEVIGTNTKAINLYKKLGFKVEYIKIYFPKTYIGMKYKKEISKTTDTGKELERTEAE